MSHLGEIAALLAAGCWTVTSIAFESAGKKVGSYTVNFIRLVQTFIILGVILLLTQGYFFPMNFQMSSVSWLIISGLIGFVLGDFFIVNAFVNLGARISLLVMSCIPPVTAILGFLILGEKMTLMNFAGMFITLFGMALVILTKEGHEISIKYPVKGLLFAFLGSFGQALGVIFSKLGMANYNIIAVTQIRVLAGIMGFMILLTVKTDWQKVIDAIVSKKVIISISFGAIFGSALGVVLSLVAVRHTTAGIASTLMGVSPIMILPISVFIFKEKVELKAIGGAFIAVLGIVLFFV